MTDSYNQNHNNVPRGSRGVAVDTQLNLDDDLVVVDTTAVAVTVTMPDATQIPGLVIAVKATNAATSGNAVTVAALAGQNVDGAASTTIVVDQGVLELKSDGANWRVMVPILSLAMRATTRITVADSPYAVLASDTDIFCDTDGGDITVNLLAGVDGTELRIINTGSSTNDVVLTPNGADLLLGSNSTVNLMDGDVAIIVFEPTEGWW